jgi:hypothetical protein
MVVFLEKFIFTQLVKELRLWYSKIHYRINRSLLLGSIVSQSNPAHICTTYFFKIHFNIILNTTPSSPFTFSDQNFICFSHFLRCVLHVLTISFPFT